MFKTMRWFLGYRGPSGSSSVANSPFGMFLTDKGEHVKEVKPNFVDIIFQRYIILRNLFLQRNGMTSDREKKITFHGENMNFKELSGHLDVYFELLFEESMKEDEMLPLKPYFQYRFTQQKKISSKKKLVAKKNLDEDNYSSDDFELDGEATKTNQFETNETKETKIDDLD